MTGIKQWHLMKMLFCAMSWISIVSPHLQYQENNIFFPVLPTQKLRGSKFPICFDRQIVHHAARCTDIFHLASVRRAKSNPVWRKLRFGTNPVHTNIQYSNPVWRNTKICCNVSYMYVTLYGNYVTPFQCESGVMCDWVVIGSMWLFFSIF